MNQMLSVAQASTADMAADIDQVIAIIAQQAMLDAGDITAGTQLADLALDSLVMVEIVFALEEAFDVTIPFNANAKDHHDAGFDMSTPAAIAAAIGGLRAA